ncbi:MAG: hypothetical protein ACKVK6_05815 [bacterium]
MLSRRLEATINMAINLSVKAKTVSRSPRSIRHLIAADVSGYHSD